MGRQSKKTQSKSALELLNFHFSTPATSEPFTRSNHTYDGARNRSKKQQYQPARRKANSAMFPLHSSSDHAFFLTRRSLSKTSSYSFCGPDEAVKWESVLVVKQFEQLQAATSTMLEPTSEEQPLCPICLDAFVCARVTKCGHVYCLPCVLRHEKTSIESYPYERVKCPCCGIPVVMDDLRPVVMETKVAPAVHHHIKLVKLHRQKCCHAPYLPLPSAPKHSNPHTAPCVGDPDAKFSRFNYIDPVWYYSHLLTDKRELEQELRILSDSCVEAVFLSMSLEMVLKCLHQASDELKEEQALQERFTNPISGMYQLQSLNETPKGCAGSQSSFEQTTMVPSSHRPNDESTSFHGSLVTSSEANDRPILMQNASRSPDTRRFRGDSIDSSSSTSRREDETSSPKSKKNAGSIYLDDSEAVHFYQAEDGQLVFLNGFNMACLLSDFSRTGPTKEDSELRPPFPDCIEGNILELQHVHLTPEVQKRMPFLSHLQLYLDLVFVELDLNNVLTSETKFKFRAELTKRKKRRQSRVHAEKRVDRAAKKEEAQRINDRKARLQVVDLEDDFFHAVVQPEPVFHGENFGPSVGGSNQAITSIDTGRRAPVSSFSEACQRSNNTLLASSSEAFPALEASHQSNISPANEHWGNRLSLESDNHIVSNHRTDRQNGPTGKKKKKGKGQKLLLFSTGGQRGSIY